MSDLEEELRSVAATPVLLIATDYDGTLAPIVDDPAAARPRREALVAIRALCELPNTEVAIISGRSLSDLAMLTGAPDDVHLVGSHGSEFDPGFADRLAPEASALLSELQRSLASIAARGHGLALEAKPASIAFHYRNAAAELAERAVADVLAGPATLAGVQTRRGKMVIELSVVPTHKGRALDTLRQRFGASAVVFLGDDATDEDAFAATGPHDLAIKVGEGETIAPWRVSGPDEVARLLARLAGARGAHLRGGSAVEIQELTFLSDQRATALVTPTAKIVWMCAPRLDSPALFAELLGGAHAGSFSVAPADGGAPVAQHYLPRTLVLRTEWPSFSVTDAFDCSSGRPGQRAGRSDLWRVIEGTGRVRLVFAPRMDFGRIETRLEPRADELAVVGGVDRIVLRAKGVRWRIEREGMHDTATADVDLDGTRLVLELRYGAVNLHEAVRSHAERQRQTLQYWRGWAEALHLPRVATQAVLRSALVLRGLCYGPTGAIAAAATTSLPEHLGGVRNWDYRFSWLRDGAQSAEALVRLGSTAEAMAFLSWVLGVLDRLSAPEALRPLYAVTGGDAGAEAEIAELTGYAASRPVRVGNAAAQQVQLDVFGPITQLIWALGDAGAPLSSEHWRLVTNLVQAVVARWREPDHGIWEIRAHPRHHVHSKVMCWLTLDRAIGLAERFGERPPPEWTMTRASIAADVTARGWNASQRAFTSWYGAEDMDAAVLWVGLSGLVPPDDERFVSTVEAVQRRLQTGALVYRYECDDGLPGREGAFLLCSAWLVDALLLLGRTREAERLFDEYRRSAGATGCIPEEYDPDRGVGLGNHPQAYSHLGLILNALNLDRALHPDGRSGRVAAR